MAAQGRCPARLDGGHDTALPARESAGLVSAVGSAVVAEDVRHLQHGPHRNQPGGITARLRRSSGLAISAINVVATWV